MPNNEGMKTNIAVSRAIEIAGGLNRLARAIGVASPTVHEWKTGKRRVPAERCLQIDKFTNGVVDCEQLRPDVEWRPIRPAVTPQSHNIDVPKLSAEQGA